MKTTLITVAVGLAVGMGAEAQAVTINWITNLEAGNTAFPSSDPLNNAPFGSLVGTTNPDFRIMSPAGYPSAGGEKAISNGVSWAFNNSNQLSAVTGSDTTPGGVLYGTYSGDYGAAPGGGTGLFRNFFMGGVPAGFLAPTVGSAAGLAYGPGVIAYDGTDAFSIYFGTLELQWNGAVFLFGHSNGGVTFDCTGAQTGAIECFAEVQLAYDDDSLGFVDQYAQWHLTGTATPFASAVPVPAAAWLFGSGFVGLMGVMRRRARA